MSCSLAEDISGFGGGCDLDDDRVDLLFTAFLGGGSKKSTYLISFVLSNWDIPASSSCSSASWSSSSDSAPRSVFPNPAASMLSSSLSPKGASSTPLREESGTDSGSTSQSTSSSSLRSSVWPIASCCSRNCACLLKSSMEKNPSFNPLGSSTYVCGCCECSTSSSMW